MDLTAMNELKCLIAEDVDEEAAALVRALKRYGQKHDLALEIVRYRNGLELLEHFPDDAQVLFLDIDMRPLDGLSAARRIRAFNQEIVMIFVTNLVQYALEGYKVSASDFLIKPVAYPELCAAMDRTLHQLQMAARVYITIREEQQLTRCEVHDILYVETYRHHVIVHTRARQIETNETMTAMEQKLSSHGFFRCHTAYLINLSFVEKLESADVVVHGEKLAVSRRHHKELAEAIMRQMGG